jgi:hypothetical protein
MDNITYTYPGAAKPTLNNIRYALTQAVQYSTVQYSTVQYSTVQYSTVQQMLPLSSHRFYILQSNHLNDFYLLLPPFCLLLASVKLCLGSRVAVLGANGAGEQQPLNSFLLSYILLLLLFCSLLLWLPVEPVAPPW